ncbi:MULTISPECIES: hypothetical protein [unclassified Enterococcus]|uniref:hypothetical protein n=1 Tax=unclassified Enterococcus TaxID=2608891 RepID=UPI0015561619|nr:MULTISPECIES: hypothetical protein [unclassified Enterococcus]MBS7577911.1 hypothetical protein [Enterococcus sp. MMGLQ5-2]MBS7585228.1 hypothetical protein [Enterococcus sp. MMGLQ5-1]NPD13085.1 hypothetical protein [Enterococcus sp. MMGLQ5-1]NPD37741.1 hypothetical protein [Enterococcus sp. MMGLQ5-2]
MLTNSLSSLTINLTDPNYALNAKFASLADNVTDGIVNIRTLLPAFATLTDSNAVNIKTLNLAIDGYAEFIPNNLTDINYLKGQIYSAI